MKARHYTLFGLFAVLMALMPITNIMAADLLPPQQPIEIASAKLQQKMQDKSFTKDFAKVNRFVEETILPHTDFDRISRKALGPLWKTATPDERERFTKEFKIQLILFYSRAFVEFKDWSIRFLPLKMENGETEVNVRTQVLQPGHDPLPVDYHMFLSNGEWKTDNIKINGVSMIQNYRNTIPQDIKTKGSLKAYIDDLAKHNTERLAAKDS